MNRILGVALLCIIVFSMMPAVTPGHYVPKAGDYFNYTETIAVNNGIGNYSGYSELTYLNGTEQAKNVSADGTVSMYYAYSYLFTNSTGARQTSSTEGNFTFSSSSFLYVNGTDNNTGYVNPTVWFYMDNLLTTGATFEILNTGMKVVSTNYSFFLTPANAYVRTIFTEGNGSYYRSDVYGSFTAAYNYKSYFDPSTGYIVGYSYTETDRDNSGNGFTYTETLYITKQSYTLTSAPAPNPNAPGINFQDYIIPIAIVAIFLVIVTAALLSRGRRKRLPQHPTSGKVDFKPVGPDAKAGATAGKMPPPIDLTPEQPKVQQIVIKETVKVECQYCGALIDSTVQKCPVCGAPRT